MLLFVLIVAVFTALDQVQGLAPPTPPTKTSCGPSLPRDCFDIKSLGFKDSGVYQVYLSEEQNSNKINVYCDFDTPGGDWLVFQRRKDGSVDFYRKFVDYALGFGDVSGEFWLGNEILHQLVSKRNYKLRIDLEDFANQKRYAEYFLFTVGPLTDYYRLKVGIYSGNAGDAMTRQNNQPFSTFDVDTNNGGCAKTYHGAWWYALCHDSNLNGGYLRGDHKSFADGVNWNQWHGYNYSLKRTEMKISPLR